MKWLLLTSLVLIAVLFSIIPSVSALPVSYNTTSINLGLSSVPRNSSSYDVFPLIPDNWLWEKFNNNTVDSSPLSVAGTITYNTNLKALWKFENVLTDSSSSGRTLTKAAGTTTYTTSGEEGSAISLDGSTYFNATDASLPTSTSPVSVTSWIFVTSFASSPAYFQYGTGAGHLFGLSFDTSGHVMFKNGSTTTQISTTALSISTFYYLTVTYDGTNAKVYINGSLDKTTTITVNTTLGGTTGLSLGALAGGANKMTGKLDEFRVYSGTALTLAQHLALYMIGHYSQSHTFDGGEYISLTNSALNTPAFTVSFWVKIPSSAEAPFSTYIARYSDGSSGQWFFDSSTGTTNNIRFHVTTSSGENGGVAVALSPNTWHYIAGSYDGTTVNFYIDGTLTQTTASIGTWSPFNNANNIVIGGTNTIVGQLDNMKFYPYALTSSQINSDYNSISPISSGKQFMSWYNGISGSATLTQKLGSTKSSLTLGCSLSSTTDPNITPLGINVYYGCTNGLNHISITSGTATHDFSVTACTATATYYPFIRQNLPMIWCISTATGAGSHTYASSTGGNQSFAVSTGAALSKLYTNQEIGANLNTSPLTYNVLKYNWNNTSTQVLNGNSCSINYTPTNTTKSLDSIVCDPSIPANATKYWNGFMITKTGNYATNSTQQFLTSIDNSSYKKLLSLPCTIMVSESPCTDFILTDFTNTDYLVILTSTHVYYKNAATALSYLNNNNYAFQSYDVILSSTPSTYPIQNPILQSMTLYGFNLNTTVTKAGLFTLPSGYSIRTTTVNPSIRLVDPQWTNDNTDIPIISTTGSLFPIYLTVSNAPAFSAIKVTQGNQLINNLESVWSVAQLDSTRSVEFDLPSGTCANVYIADISVSPSVWTFQGIICATGVNQKTMAYTNTLPINFWSLPYGVTHTYQPTNNGLTTSFHSTQSPVTYTVVIKNSTGTTAVNSTFVLPANQTLQTESFNVSSVTKPAGLFVYVGGNMVYSAYLGSALSLASVTSFFNQYFTYQGFNLIAFVPIIFASMFTRNTIGIGVVLTVIFIATLSWLSIVVIPDAYIFVMAFIGILSLLAYRIYYG